MLKNLQSLKLHEAMVIILLDQPNFSADAQIISDKIYERSLYLKKDDGKAESFQIRLRAKNYSNLFEVNGRTIELSIALKH